MESEKSSLPAVVKSPVIFNAFAVVAVLTLVLGSGGIDPPVLWFGLVFVAVVTVGLNAFAYLNPRFLTYGPQEYLRESEMVHERRMAGKE